MRTAFARTSSSSAPASEKTRFAGAAGQLHSPSPYNRQDQPVFETALRARDGSALTKAVEAARSRVTLLEQEVDAETVRERIEAYLNIIGRYMTDYSADLDIEHKGSQLRLDIKNLTVVADTLDGPVPLQRMGSGETGSATMCWRTSHYTGGSDRSDGRCRLS